MDRLLELKRSAIQQQEGDLEKSEERFETKELEDSHSDYLLRIEELKENLCELTVTIDELQQISQNVIQAVIPKREKQYSKQFIDTIAKANQLAQSIKQKIQRLQLSTKERLQVTFAHSAEIRLRENWLGTIVNKYRHLIKEYQNIQTNAKISLKRKVTRQILLVNPDFQEFEIEQDLKNNDSQKYIKDAILKSSEPAESIQNAYLVVQSKYDDMKRLETSIAELNGLFLDLGTVTTQQGELLDQIEMNVSQSKEYVEEGNVELEKATGFLISVQAKRTCIALIIIVIVALIVGLVSARATGSL